MVSYSFFLLGLLLALICFGMAAYFFIALNKCRNDLEEQKKKNAFTLSVLDKAPFNIFFLDQEFSISWCNKTSAEAVGRSQTTLVGEKISAIDLDFSEGQAYATTRQTTELLRTYGNLCGDNEVCVPTEVYFTRMDEPDGRHCYVRYERDISGEIKLANEISRSKKNLKQTREAAEVASRMKSEFIANMNHEIRTPMNAIMGYAEMLVDSDLGKREKRFVEIIHKSGLSLITILNDVMDLSKIEAGRMKIVRTSVRLTGIVDEVINLFLGQIHEKNLQLKKEVASNLPPIVVLDGTRLKQILQNLVSNAVKFTDRGSISLTITGEKSDPATGGISGCYDICFSVEDTGLGIPVIEQLDIISLFKEYDEDVAKEYGGLGLGLTLCSRLVHMMDGEIDVTSTEGIGSCFTVCFKNISVSIESESNRLARQVVTSSKERRATKILVVDDMSLITDVFRDYFVNTPVTVLTATNGEDALELAINEAPGVIFMDLNLIGMGGRAVTEKIRQDKRISAIPVIVMTGNILEEEDFKPLFDAFLQKPFHLEELKSIVQQYIDVDGSGAEMSNEQLEQPEEVEGIPFAILKQFWNRELDQLLQQAYGSGSLAAATALGLSLKKTGESVSQEAMVMVGNELITYAAEPDILGVDKLLSQLHREICKSEHG